MSDCGPYCCRGWRKERVGDCRAARVTACSPYGSNPSASLRVSPASPLRPTIAGGLLRDPLLFFALGLFTQFCFLTWIGSF
jgi:hypothetical protein